MFPPMDPASQQQNMNDWMAQMQRNSAAYQQQQQMAMASAMAAGIHPSMWTAQYNMLLSGQNPAVMGILTTEFAIRGNPIYGGNEGKDQDWRIRCCSEVIGFVVIHTKAGILSRCGWFIETRERWKRERERNELGANTFAREERDAFIEQEQRREERESTT